MTQSLVPQVDQPNRKQVEEIRDRHASEVPTYEEASKFRSFNLGSTVNSVVLQFWRHSEVIQKGELAEPYCMHSHNEDECWNFSWGFDDAVRGDSTRSCFYTFKPDGSVLCREYPTDRIQLNTLLDAYNLACVIISDLLQSHDWDKQQTADRLDALMQAAQQRDS